ncbi:MAG: DNRLRE domain-containing protein [Planctomycetaceae bacterium]|nr:DNRLRE domain-containing protein [Planctomycetaceae bacterium]
MKKPSQRRRRQLAVERFETRKLLAALEFAAVADNTIYETFDSSDRSNGVGQYLLAGRTGNGGDFAALRSLIEFDVSSIPAEATIESVRLELNLSAVAPGSGVRDVSIFPVLSPWGEGMSHAPGAEGNGAASQQNDASWYKRFFPNSAWQQEGGDFNPNTPSATIPIQIVDQVYTWTSDQMKVDVSNWLADADSNFGWIILGDEEDDRTIRKFDSRDAPDASKHPKLIVEVSGVDLDSPEPILTGPASPTNTSPIDVTIDFGEEVENFIANDISVSGGEVTNLQAGINGRFVATIEADGDGIVTINVPADVATDLAGNANLAATSLEIEIDQTPPAPAITGPDSPLLNPLFDIAINFGESVVDFEASDIGVSNGSIESLTDNGNGGYTAAIRGTAGTTVAVNVAAAVASDLAGNPNTSASQFTAQILLPSLDFGDAPNPYPVLESSDGARHSLGDLFLGNLVDAEFDGAPSPLADGDEPDEDGIVAIATLLSGDQPTLSSLAVTASKAGKLDGWVDFTQDGDWDDSGEQIFTSVSLIAGENILAVSVPADSLSGQTFARFRVSEAGGLTPTGSVSNGEVEDHLVTLSDASIGSTIMIQMVDPNLDVEVIQGDLTVSSPTADRFRAPLSSFGRLELQGTEQSDSVTIDLRSFKVPSNGLLIQGQAGSNRLQLKGASASLNFTSPTVVISDFETLDLRHPDNTTIVLNASTVSELQPNDRQVELLLGIDDTLIMNDVANWRMGEAILVADEFRLTADSLTGSEQLVVATPRPWHNPLQPSDINNNGDVSAADALVIVNELARQSVIEADGTLVDPASLGQWPGIYYDQNHDGKLSSLDALRVINRLAILSSGGGESEGWPSSPALTRATSTPTIPSELRLNSLQSFTAIDKAVSKISDFAVQQESTSNESAIDAVKMGQRDHDACEAIDTVLRSGIV